MSEGILINRTSGISFISYALARVIAPAGTSVTLTSPRGTTKTITSDKAKPLESNTNFNVYYFNVGTTEFGSCTITGVDGSYTMTKTVSITNNVEYTFELSHRCPSGYQELEWIRIPQKAYIDIGKCLSNKSTYKFDFIVAIESLSAEYTLMSPHSSTRPRFVVNPSGQIFLSEYGGGSSLTGQIVANRFHHIIINENKNLKIAVDGQVSPTNYGAVYFSGSTDTYLLNCYYRQADGYYTYFNTKWKEFIVTDQDTNTIVCDLIPCKRISDSACGFYDVTANVFLVNAGASTITAGPNV